LAIERGSANLRVRLNHRKQATSVTFDASLVPKFTICRSNSPQHQTEPVVATQVLLGRAPETRQLVRSASAANGSRCSECGHLAGCIPHSGFARGHGRWRNKERKKAPNETHLGRRKGKPNPTVNRGIQRVFAAFSWAVGGQLYPFWAAVYLGGI